MRSGKTSFTSGPPAGSGGLVLQGRITSEGNWTQLLRWNRKAQAAGKPARVFVASLADVFDEAAPQAAQLKLWRFIEHCSHLEFLLLTKRPQNWESMLPIEWLAAWPHSVRLGFTAEDQRRWNERYPLAESLIAKYPTIQPMFVSCEPLLGPIEFVPGYGLVPLEIGWVICGGESGPGARAMNADWARRLRDQCFDTGVPFFFKQWGEWMPTTDPKIAEARGIQLSDCMSYVGRKTAGALLDGEQHKEFSAPAAEL